jgi:hypothetical protein
MEEIGRVAWSPDGRLLASASVDRTAAIWELSSGRMLRRLSGHSKTLSCVAWLPDNLHVVTAAFDHSLRIWNAESGEQLAMLEGHADRVWCVSVMSSGNVLASYGGDAIRIWRFDRFESVEVIHHERPSGRLQSLEFHPTQPILAAITDGGECISLWRLDVPRLLRAPKRPDAVRYANAKVVLVGDTGVGKSGLAIRLVHDRFEPTVSTHGSTGAGPGSRDGRRSGCRRASDRPRNAAVGSGGAARLSAWSTNCRWTMRRWRWCCSTPAVKPIRSAVRPTGRRRWSGAIERADQETAGGRERRPRRSGRQPRADRSVPARAWLRRVLPHQRLDRRRTRGTAGRHPPAISWDRLPIVSSNWLLTGLRSFRQAARRPQPTAAGVGGRTVATGAGGRSVGNVSDADGNLTFDQFAACLRRLHEADVIELLTYQATEQNPAADADVLLEPTFVDAYASAVIVAARDEPDGLGHVRETEILEGRFPLERCRALADRQAERKVLVAVIERFLDREIAFRERIEGADYLVFPSQYTRESPFPGSSSYGIRYDFAGPLLSIFATLAVRLAHHSGFRNRQFYRNAAAYEPVDGGRCVILFEDLEEGRGRLSVFFEEGVSGEAQGDFSAVRLRALDAEGRAGQHRSPTGVSLSAMRLSVRRPSGRTPTGARRRSDRLFQLRYALAAVRSVAGIRATGTAK